MTTPDPLRRAAQATPDAPALAAERGDWSYARLDHAADRLARRLVDGGVRPGDRVALLLPPGPEGVLAVHAVPRVGATLAPLNVGWSEPERERALGALAPRVILATRETRPAEAAPGPGARPTMVMGRADLDDPGGETEGVPSSAPAPAETPAPFAILWTSGTGGRPRGVELTRQNLEASARASLAHLDLRASDSWYAALNLAHVGGLALVVRAAVVGCRVLARDGFSAGDLNRRIDAGDVTHASLVPTMLDRLLEDRAMAPAPPSLRCILLGGAAAPVALVRRAVAAGFPVALTYGLTEASSQVATAPPELVRRALQASVAEGGAAGGTSPGLPGAPPLPGVELRIAENGEILVRGPTVARGYFRPAATAQAPAAGKAPIAAAATGPEAAGRGADVPAEFPLRDGWLHTGDIGTLDPDGHLRVTGRISDRIITGGVNVDPVEVEEVVRAHPAVLDAAVLGLPDEKWGERVAVAVVLAPGFALDPAALLAFARPQLAPAKRPRALAVVEALPRNRNGKVDRERLRGLDWR